MTHTTSLARMKGIAFLLLLAGAAGLYVVATWLQATHPAWL